MLSTSSHDQHKLFLTSTYTHLQTHTHTHRWSSSWLPWRSSFTQTCSPMSTTSPSQGTWQVGLFLTPTLHARKEGLPKQWFVARMPGTHCKLATVVKGEGRLVVMVWSVHHKICYITFGLRVACYHLWVECWSWVMEYLSVISSTPVTVFKKCTARPTYISMKQHKTIWNWCSCGL